MRKLTYWLLFWICILGIIASMVLTGIGAWKFGETFDDSVVLPYASATPLLIISVIGLVVIARKKPIEKASK